MKTLRCNTATYRELFKVKHEQELIKMDVVNMTDVLDVVVFRYNKMRELLEAEAPEELQELIDIKFKFTDKAEVVAVPLEDEDEDEEDEDEEEVEEPRKPRRQQARRKKTTRKRRAS
jgi:hypothetical protein